MSDKLIEKNNLTLEDLRSLREVYRDILGNSFAVFVTLELVHYQEEAGNGIREELQIWYSGIERHLSFTSLREAYSHLEEMKKGRRSQ